MQVAGKHVGIDLGKRTYNMCAIERDGRVVRLDGRTDDEGMARLCGRLSSHDAVAMEACNMAFIIERRLRKEVGCKVIVLNSRKLAVIYASTRKTDKEDSLKLAKLVRTYEEEDMPTVRPPSDEEWARRKLLSEQRSLKAQRTREINRLHAIFEHAGLTQFVRKDMATKKSRDKILPLLDGYEKGEAERLVARLDLLEDQIAALTQKIDEECDKDEKIQKAMRVPGIGPVTALAFVAYVGDLERFENARQVSNFIGFVPKVDCSCTISRYGHSTKQGNPILRSLLVQAAWSLVRSKRGGALREKYEYMAKTRGVGKGKSIVTIARKLGELLYTLLKTGGEYEVRKFVPPQSQVQKLADAALEAS